MQRDKLCGPVVRLDVRASVRCPPLTSVSRDAIPSYLWRDFDETNHKYSACEWEVLKRFSRSEVKDQVIERPNAFFRLIGIPIDYTAGRPLSVRRRHADDGVASRRLCFSVFLFFCMSVCLLATLRENY